MERENRKSAWTKQKNRRRCELIDKQIDSELSPVEASELEQLQSEMLAYRNRVAPLPLDDLREFYDDIVQEYQERTE